MPAQALINMLGNFMHTMMGNTGNQANMGNMMGNMMDNMGNSMGNNMMGNIMGNMGNSMGNNMGNAGSIGNMLGNMRNEGKKRGNAGNALGDIDKTFRPRPKSHASLPALTCGGTEDEDDDGDQQAADDDDRQDGGTDVGDDDEKIPAPRAAIPADQHIADMRAALCAATATPVTVPKTAGKTKPKGKAKASVLKRPSASLSLSDLPMPFAGEVSKYSSRGSYTSKYSHGTKKFLINAGLSHEEACEKASTVSKRAGAIWDEAVSKKKRKK